MECDNDSVSWDKAKKEEFLKFAELELNRHEQELEAHKNRQKVSQEKIAMLEDKIRQIKESQSIANILKEKKDALMVKQLKKTRVDQLKSTTVTLQQELNSKQDENRRREEELGKRKADLKSRIQNWNLQLNKAKKQLSDITELGNRLLDTTREVQIINHFDQKIKETIQSITEKQAKLASRKNQETELIRLNVEKDVMETQMEIVEKQLKWVKNEKEAQQTTKSEMAKVLSILKDKKDDLKAQLLCHEKNQLMQRFQLLKKIEILKKENEDDERTVEMEEMELKMRMGTVKQLERKIRKVDAPKKKKKEITNEKQLVPKSEMSAFDELLLRTPSASMARRKV